MPNKKLNWKSLSRKIYMICLVTTLFLPFQNCTGGFSTLKLETSIPEEPESEVIAPTNLTASNVAFNQIQLTWQDNSSDETEFSIERALAAGSNYVQVGTSSANTNSFTVTSLTPSTNYWFRVRASRSGTFSNYSNILATATTGTPAPETPTAPSNLMTSVVSSTQINLSWTDNSNNEQGFYIERRTGSGEFSQIAQVNSNITNYSNMGLTASTSYSYRVRAYNAAGNSTYSSVATATTQAPAPQAPTAPSNLTTNVISTTQINLTWTDNANNEQGFYIERRTGSGEFSQIAQVNSNITNYSNTGLTAGTSYSYRVRAYNATGNSAYSSIATATTESTPPGPNMKYVFMAQGHLGRTIMSCDGGLTWINDRSDNPNGHCWTTPNEVECDHTAISARGLDAGDGYFFVNYGWGAPGTVKRSQDGVNWTTIRSGGTGDGILYHNGNLWSSWGIYESAYSTNHGQTWTTNSGLTYLEHPLAHRAGNLFFYVSRDRDGLALSQDGGRTWIDRPEVGNSWAKFFAYGNNIHLMVGGSSATRSLNNGTTWTRNANAITGTFIGLVFNGTHFVGWTSSARWQSADGVTWSQTAITNNSGLALNSPIAYNPETNTYVSIPNHWGAYYQNQRALYSTNGINWTQLSTSAFPGGHPILRIVSGPMNASYCP